jgi:hypothetical protein
MEIHSLHEEPRSGGEFSQDTEMVPLPTPSHVWIPEIRERIFENLIIEGDIQSLDALSQTCRFFYHILLKNPDATGSYPYKIILALHQIDSKIKNIFSDIHEKEDVLFSERESQATIELAQLTKGQRHWTERFQKNKQDYYEQLSLLKENMQPSEQELLTKAVVLADMCEKLMSVDQSLKENIPDFIKDLNKNTLPLFRNKELVESTDYLIQQTDQPISPYRLSCKKLFKGIGKNKYIVLGGTLLSTATFITGGILLYSQYVKQEAFFNQNMTSITDVSDLNKLSPLFRAWLNSPTIEWHNNTARGTSGYSSRGHEFTPANLSQWVRDLSSQTGCLYDYWYPQLAAVINNTQDVLSGFLPCFQNPDRSLCCGTFWPRNPDRYRYCDADYCARIFYGGLDSHSFTIKAIIYCFVLGPIFVPTFIWIMLLSHFCL